MTPNPNTTDCRDRADAVAVCPLDLIPPGEGRCVRIGTLQIAVFRQRDGAVFALEPRCPHQGGPLADGLVGAGVLVCPLHGWRFGLADGKGIDNELAVRAYPVEVREGRVWLRGLENHE